MILNSLRSVKEEKKLLQAFGDALREIRNAQSFSQQALADLSGVDRAYISQLELGESVPSILIIFKLAETLKVKPSDIVNLMSQKSQQSPSQKSK